MLVTRNEDIYKFAEVIKIECDMSLDYELYIIHLEMLG